MTLEEFIDRLDGQKNYSARGVQCRCPAHTDNVNSLSVTEDEEKILIYCHAGCNWKEILDAMGLRAKDLFVTEPYGEHFNEGRASVMEQPEAIYDYHNEDGSLEFQVVRYPGKKFRQRRLTEEGWTWNLDGVKKVPYRLPDLLSPSSAGVLVSDPLFIVEGEKDVETLYDMGYRATCFPGGAGKGKFLARYVKYFIEEQVIIIPDDDDPGIAYADEILDALTGVAASAKIVRTTKGKDITEHIENGGMIDALLKEGR